MAEIRCPNCGFDNPDFLDLCQFCQTPLRTEDVVQIGEEPTKKDTGELEPVLPDWLKEIRQQARESAEEDAAHEAARREVGQDEAPDLLAGLASQAAAEHEETPDWLAGIAPAEKIKTPPSSPPASEDFFAQFNQPAADSAEAQTEPQPEETDSAVPLSSEQDELSAWFSQAADQASAPFTVEPGESPEDVLTPGHLGSTDRLSEPDAAQEPEDLSWLYDLEASAKGTAEPAPSGPDTDRSPADAAAAESSDDLSWLNQLGGLAESAESIAPSASEEDEGLPEPVLGDTQLQRPAGLEEDLSWLNDLGSIAERSAPEEVKPPPQEDLGWLRDLGAPADQTPEGALPSLETDSPRMEEVEEQPEVAESSAPAISPRRTAPLGEARTYDSVPDWLKSATEEASMPPLGAGALDWYASHVTDQDQAAEGTPPVQQSASARAEDLEHMPGSTEPAGESTEPEQPAPAGEDLESLLSADLPDWLSRPAADIGTGEESPVQSLPGDQALAPVDLPSWVQAMRPVEAVLSESGAAEEDKQPETEGPLAGISGVIPPAPIGVSPRPKPISLKLQPTAEQQTSAALLEQMLTAETTPRTLAASSPQMPQRELRWAISALVLLILGAMIALGSRAMPVPATLPLEVSNLSSTIQNLPANSSILVVVDFEPSVTGEMEAAAGPLLVQLAKTRQAGFTLLSTSTTGPALAERLITRTGISLLPPDGLAFQPGENYFNLGYLPGGTAGVLAFIDSPQTAFPGASVTSLSSYAAVVLLTDHAESGRLWVEQLQARRQADAGLGGQPLLVVASAQAGPLLQPYVSSGQISGMITGLSDGARFEFVNNIQTGAARTYWDAFGTGLLLAVVLIGFGSLWGLLMRIRSGSSGVEQG